jgi:signal transduction histidine kinase
MMPDSAVQSVGARWFARIRLPRRTVRLRLTLLYGGLFLLSGAGLLTLTYVLAAKTFPVLVQTQSSSGSSAGIGAGTLPGDLQQAFSALESQAAQQRAGALHELVVQSGIALAIMAVLSIGLGWLVAGRVLRPLRTITAAAQHISASNLHQRLALANPDDELKELADTFDGLLGRLERAFDAQRQFVANASHELRTPLARQRTVVEVALADRNPTVAGLQSACERVLAASVQQERLIEALLTLAHSQRGLRQRGPVDLVAITRDALASREAEARQRGITMSANLGPALVSGDSALAERLVANLLDNALRHNTANGWIKITIGMRAGWAALDVANSGPVIPPAEVSRLFEPFQRLGADRTAAGGGLGLGLSIVSAIVAAHEARIDARALPEGGLEILVRFPRPVAPAAAGPVPAPTVRQPQSPYAEVGPASSTSSMSELNGWPVTGRNG